MWYASLMGMVLILLVVLLHYQVLKTILRRLPRQQRLPRYGVIAAIYLIIITHIIEVILFAIAYYIGVEALGVGELKGSFGGDFREYIYFSLVSYTSLGLGDVYPYGAIRLLTGIEALTGLIMIGWTATFTYMVMSRLWDSTDSHH